MNFREESCRAFHPQSTLFYRNLISPQFHIFNLISLFFLVVGNLCDRQSSCSISVEPSTFQIGQDPCPRTSKYLNVKYECQTIDSQCPGVAFSASPPKEDFTTYRQEVCLIFFSD